MGFRRTIMRVGMVVIVICAQLGTVGSIAVADGPTSPQLVISQFKVTASDGQFFTLYNPSTTASIDLAGFELEYFNNNDLTKATSSKIIPLGGSLAPQSYYMLSDGVATICYQATVDTVSLGFSTTSGFAEVLQLPQQTTAGTLVVPSVSDYVGWKKTSSGGNDTLTISPSASTVTIPTATSINWLRQLPVQTSGANAWQPVRPDPSNGCSLQLVQSAGTTGTQQTIANPGNHLAVGQQPPASIVSLASSTPDSATPSLPSADVGLAAPQITETLPNPMGTGNDDTDEFIELYNSNPTPFDLSGFTLQTGTTTKHSYAFPDGTLLSSMAFTAFFSADTGLSLSNTSGQADLLDPFGNMLSQTDSYGTAKDGQSWALANGKWYWTTDVTPSAANIVKQPATTAKAAAKTSKTTTSSKSSGSVQGASTNTASTSSASDTNPAPAPIHPIVLAAIGVIAVGYGIYEYRHDLANKLYELRRNRTIRRTARV